MPRCCFGRTLKIKSVNGCLSLLPVLYPRVNGFIKIQVSLFFSSSPLQLGACRRKQKAGSNLCWYSSLKTVRLLKEDDSFHDIPRKLPVQHEGTVTGLIVLDVFEVEQSDSESFCVQHLQATEAAEMFLLYSFICFCCCCCFNQPVECFWICRVIAGEQQNNPPAGSSWRTLSFAVCNTVQGTRGRRKRSTVTCLRFRFSDWASSSWNSFLNNLSLLNYWNDVLDAQQQAHLPQMCAQCSNA